MATIESKLIAIRAMSTRANAIFDSLFRDRVGVAAFARGKPYGDNGAVQEPAQHDPKTVAEATFTLFTWAETHVNQALTLLQPVPRAQWLAYLRAEYKAKRNFIKELPAS